MNNESVNMRKFKNIEKELRYSLMPYKFGLEEMKTKINILNEEFEYIHDYNPIEHIKSRMKSPKSILNKLNKNNLDISLDSMKENIKDIAGLRIVCSFVSDIYVIADMLRKQADLKVIEYKDYIKNPKANGYQSLHLIMQVPVFMSDRVEDVFVEVQIRTIGMEFWASLEHKIYYKYDKEVPKRLKDELKEAASIVSDLDKKMESLNEEVSKIKKVNDNNEEIVSFPTKFNLPDQVEKFFGLDE